MKTFRLLRLRIFLAGLTLFILSVADATTYYSFGNNAPNLTASWWTNTNGTGSHPGNFTTAADVFTVQNGHTYTSTGAWTVSGSVTVATGGTLVIATSNLISIPTLTATGTGSVTNNGTMTVATNLTGTGTFINAATGTLNYGATATIAITTFTISAAGNTVNYNGTAQTVRTGTYSNLTVSGSGAKTTTSVTVTGIFTRAGTATVTTVPSYGTNSTLVYSGSTAQTTSTEFPASFTGTGGVVSNNALGVTTNAAKTVSKLTVNAGALFTTSTTAGYTLSVTGITDISGSLNIAGDANKAFTGDITVYSGGTFTVPATSIVVNAVNLTVLAGGTLKHNSNYDNASKVMTLTGNLSIDGTYDYTGFTPAIFMNGTGNKNINTGTTALYQLFLRTADYYATGDVTVVNQFYAMWNLAGGSFHTNGNDVVANWGIVNAGGTLFVDGGSLTVTTATIGGLLIGRTTPGANGALTVSAGTLTSPGIYVGNPTLPTPLFTGAFTHSGGTVNIDLLSVEKSSSYTCSNAPVLNVNGSVSNSGTFSTLASGTPSINITGSLTNSTTGSITNAALSSPAMVINGSILNSGTLTPAATATISLKGNWTNDGTSISTGGTVTFNGTGNQAIGGTSTTTFGSLVINPSVGVTVSTTNNISILSNLAVNSGTFDISTYPANRTTAGGSFTLATSSTLKLSGGSGGTVSSNFPNNFTTHTFNTNSTVEYYGTVAQTVYATPVYGNLTVSGNSTKTAGAGLTIAKDLNINSSSVFAGGSYSHSVAGDWKNNVSATAYTPATSTVTFNGSALQTIGGTSGTSFNNLVISNAAGATMSQDQTVNSTLTLSSGTLNIGAKNLTLAGTTAVAGSSFSPSKMIIASGGGEVRKTFSTTGSYLFPIGDNTGTIEYSPITLNITSGTFAGGAYAGVAVTNAKHSNNASTTDYLNRYWTLSNNGITTPSFTISATYLAADIAGTESGIAAAKFTGSLPWVKYGVIGSNILATTAASNTGTGIFFTGITNKVPAVSISGGGISICSAGSASLGSSVTNNGTSSISYAWSPSTGLSSAVVSNPTSTPASTTTYSLIVTDGNGITSTAATTTITVNVPAAPTGSVTTQPTCATATGTITITAPTGTGMTYSTDGITYSNTTIFAAMPAGTYNLTAKNSTGCISSITSVTVNAQPATPAAPTALVTTQPTCATATGTITITAPTGTGMTYSTDGVTYTNTTGIFTAMSAASYNLTAKNSSGCISTAASVTVNAQPTLPTGALSGTAIICNGGTTNLVITATGPGTISGTLSDGTPFTGTAPNITVAVSPSATITYTISTLTNGTCVAVAGGKTGSATITVNAAPAATISYAGPFCWNSGTAAVTFSGTAGGVYSASPSGASINSSTGAINLLTSSPGNYTVSYTVAASGGCALYTTTTNVIINPNTWTGAISSDWNLPANWAGNAVPTPSCPDVTVLSGVPHQPTLSSGTFAIHNLFIMPGAVLEVNNAVLQIAGAITNNGTFKVSLGTIEMNGNAAQTIPANAFYNNALKNLVVSNTSVTGLSLGGALDIYGSLTYTGSGKKLNTNDLLTLKSTASNTAWVGDMTGNTISGKVTVERFISAKRAWRLLSVPTSTSQTIKQAWQEGATNTAANPVSGYGIQITTNAANWASNGFDVYSPNGPSLKTYNSATNAWVDIGSTNIPFPFPDKGYMTFIRGDRTANGLYSTPTISVIRTKGNLYTGDQAPILVGASKFACIGNPFASALDFRSIVKSGMKDFFYVWDPNLSGSEGLGAYQTFSLSGSDYVVTPGQGSYGSAGSVSNFLQSGHGFIMQATAAGGSITFKEAAKTSGSMLALRPVVPLTQQLRINLQGINTDGTSYMADGVLINYDDNYSNVVDDMDALKAGNTNETMSIKTGGTLLVVERKHSIDQHDTVFLNMKQLRIQSYRLEVIAANFTNTALVGFVEDRYLNTRSLLNLTGNTTITFPVVNVPASYALDRFRLVFESAVVLPVKFVSVKAARKNNTNIIDWNVENEINIKQYEVERSSDGNNFVVVNTTLAKNLPSGNYNWSDLTASVGYNYYRVKSIDASGKIVYSQVVKINVKSSAGEITIYPNPAPDGIVNLQMVNQPGGNYSMRLLNTSGQVIMQKKFIHAGANSTEIITFTNNVAKGAYQLELTKPDGSKLITKLLF